MQHISTRGLLHSQQSKEERAQHTATHCNTLQHTATHCNAHCNTYQSEGICNRNKSRYKARNTLGYIYIYIWLYIYTYVYIYVCIYIYIGLLDCVCESSHMLRVTWRNESCDMNCVTSHNESREFCHAAS